MKSRSSVTTWIKVGFFALGFGLMSEIVIFALQKFIVPRYISPLVDESDPRGVDILLGAILLPFWFFLGVLAGMMSVNLSLRMSKSQKAKFLPHGAAIGYTIVLYGVISFAHGLMRQR